MAPEKERDRSIFSGANPQGSKVEAAWEALQRHGRAGIGRPRKDSQRPTLKQLGLTKWTARRAQAIAAANLSDEDMRAMGQHQRGRSVTALLEHNARLGRRRNPLFRAWRVAMQAERQEFLEALRQLAFFAEREADISQD